MAETTVDSPRVTTVVLDPHWHPRQPDLTLADLLGTARRLGAAPEDVRLLALSRRYDGTEPHHLVVDPHEVTVERLRDLGAVVRFGWNHDDCIDADEHSSVCAELAADDVALNYADRLWQAVETALPAIDDADSREAVTAAAAAFAQFRNPAAQP